jgi:hypothetical protein
LGLTATAFFQLRQQDRGPRFILAGATLALICVGFFLGLSIHILRHGMDIHENKVMKRRYGVLYVDFREHRYPFFVALLLHRFVCAVLIGFLDDPRIQIFGVAGNHLFLLITIMFMFPFNSSVTNRISAFLEVIKIVQVGALVLLSSTVISTNFLVKSIVGLALLVLNVFILLIMFFIILWNLVRNVCKRARNKKHKGSKDIGDTVTVTNDRKYAHDDFRRKNMQEESEFVVNNEPYSRTPRGGSRAASPAPAYDNYRAQSPRPSPSEVDFSVPSNNRPVTPTKKGEQRPRHESHYFDDDRTSYHGGGRDSFYNDRDSYYGGGDRRRDSYARDTYYGHSGGSGGGSGGGARDYYRDTYYDRRDRPDSRYSRG